jgi:hypothetical protein
MRKAAIQMTAIPPAETPMMRPRDVDLEEQQGCGRKSEI